MTYVLLVLATLCAIDVSFARADPISTFQVTDATIFMRPNLGGSGDNVRFTFTGPGLDVEGFGGMGCFSWCTGDAIPLDGPTDPTQIFVGDFSKAVLGGVAYTEFDMGQPPFFNESGGLNPIAMGHFGSGPTFSEFRMLLPPNGSWSLNFEPARDANGNPARSFVNGTFSASALTPTPEPGTFGLLLSGSAAIGWITRRRRKFRDA